MRKLSTCLTPQQEAFAKGLFCKMSQRSAYVQAFGCEGMLSVDILHKAQDLAEDHRVIARIEEMRDAMTFNRNMLKEKTLSELSRIAFADMKDFVTFRTEAVLTIGLDGKQYTVRKHVVDIKDSNEVDGSLIQEISLGKDGTFKFKLHDKAAALDKICKILSMYTDEKQVKATTSDGAVYVFQMIPPDQDDRNTVEHREMLEEIADSSGIKSELLDDDEDSVDFDD